jgi:hypothetical protein
LYTAYTREKFPNIDTWNYIDGFLTTGKKYEDVKAPDKLENQLTEAGWQMDTRET